MSPRLNLTGRATYPQAQISAQDNHKETSYVCAYGYNAMHFIFRFTHSRIHIEAIENSSCENASPSKVAAKDVG